MSQLCWGCFALARELYSQPPFAGGSNPFVVVEKDQRKSGMLKRRRKSHHLVLRRECVMIQITPPKTNECPLKKGHFKGKGLSSNHYVSGDMLVFFWGVITQSRWLDTPQKNRFLKGHDKARLMGVAIAIDPFQVVYLFFLFFFELV